MLRRWSLGLLVSLLTHVGAVVTALVVAGGGLPGPVEIEVTGLRVDELKDLPLGGPEKGAAKQAARSRARSRGPRAAPESGTLTTRPGDEQPSKGTSPERDEGGPAPTSDLTAYGPQGSRVTVLMRLDRLRGTDYIAPLDGLLMYLPDRRELLHSTGLNLFTDFDAVLVATPNPLDPAVTFLAARHHLDDAALRAALGRGVRGTNHTLVWQTQAGRPVGEWRWRTSQGGTYQARDARLIVLAAPGLAVVTPPAYRALLLAPAAAAPDGRTAHGGADARVDARVDRRVDGGADGGSDGAGLGWAGLLSRIDAEEGLMPSDGVVMINVVDVLKPAARSPDQPPMLYGMEVPPSLNAVIGIGDSPYLDVVGTFKSEAAARHWEAEWPAIQRRLRANPYLVLSGFSALVGRIALSRDDAAVRVHLDVTRDETLRLLAIAGSFLSARFGEPPGGAASPPLH